MARSAAAVLTPAALLKAAALLEAAALVRSAALGAVLGASAGVCLYKRIDQELFGRILVAAMLVGGITYIGHAAAELLGEAKALPNPLHHIGWMLGFYVDAVLDPHVGS